MSKDAKKAREALKAKARRLASANSEKVDSSTFTPAEPLNADVKTGMRPISRRAFRSGGKVTGAPAKAHAGKKPRKSGGKVEASQWVNAKVNRDVKAANEEREGKKHIGGLKSGGRASHARGGRTPSAIDLGQAERGLRNNSDSKKTYNVVDKSGKVISSHSSQRDAIRALSRSGDGPDFNGNSIKSGMKTGGRAKKTKGGVPLPPEMPESVKRTRAEALAESMVDQQKRKDGRALPPDMSKQIPGDHATNAGGYAPQKRGGRTKKMAGGPMMDPRLGIVRGKALPGGDALITPGMKKGGKVKGHSDEAMDKALIKKMVKPSARTGKAEGGVTKYLGAGPEGNDEQKDAEAEYGKRESALSRAMNRIENDFSPAAMRKMRKEVADRRAKDKGLQAFIARRKKRDESDSMKKAGYATGGMIEDSKKALMLKADPHNQSKIKPAAPKKEEAKEKACGGRMARKSGGRAKGKTHINIVIATGKGQQDPMAGGMPPMPPGGPMGGPPRPPGGVPVPMPPAGGAPGGAPMAMPVPMPMPAPQQQPPMARKSGGRVSKVAKSYNDMEAGSGSGEGRLQKTDIAKRNRKDVNEKGDKVFTGLGYPNKVPGATGGRTARKAGGGVYRSYKDMDAGAGSGQGRLEKTDIAKHKK